MQTSHLVSVIPWLLAACAGLMACISGRTDDGESVQVGQGGAINSAAGSAGMPGGGTGATPSNGGGGMGGSGGASGSGGTGGGGTGGSGGTGGGGTAGTGGSGGTGEEGKIILFDGTSLDGWISRNTGNPAPWTVNPDGTMEVIPGTGDIISVQEFEDVFVHIEYMTPMLPSNVGGQDRGNSGVYLKGMYEMQVLDSYSQPPLIDGCGAVYGVAAPLTVACNQELEWNTYEIEFQAPRYEGDQKVSSAVIVEAKLNGVVVQTNTSVPGTTSAGLPEAPGPAGLLLQDHSNQVWFKNIWVIPRETP
jgi:hypothetical protein